ncbi:YadA-like family protein [Paraburkholderia phymatum]
MELSAASDVASNRGAALAGTLSGGAGPGGAMTTQGRSFGSTQARGVLAAGCGVANGTDTTATGLCASAGSIANVNGATATTVANGATAYGSQSLAQDTNTTAIGFRATAMNEGSVALGYQSRALGDPTVAVGANTIASGSNAVALGANASATAPSSVAIGANSIADQPNTVSVGSPGNERRITNVAPGINPTDAVNVSQLQGVQRDVNNVARYAYSGVAMAGALAGLPQVEAGKTFQIGAGVGSYGGYAALALGASAHVTQSTVVKLGVSATGGSRVLVNAGMGYSW